MYQRKDKSGMVCGKKRLHSAFTACIAAAVLSCIAMTGCSHNKNLKLNTNCKVQKGNNMKKNDAFIGLLCELIRMRPVSSDIDAVNRVQERMMQFLTDRGLHCTMEKDGKRNVLFAATSPGKIQDHILCVHLDVVPAMNESQFEPVFKDGILYARGSKDCLGHAVAAAKILCSAPAGKKVGCIFTANEEIGGSTTAFMVKQGYRAEKCGYVLDGGNGVIYGQKGIVNIKITANGRGGHASAPWAFDNPNIKLVNGLQKLFAAWENPKGLEDWRSSIALTDMKCGPVAHQAGRCRNDLQFRQGENRS